MNDEQRKAIQSLREQGFAITLFCPEELEGVDRNDIETAMSREGNEAIEILKPHPEENAA